MASRIFNSIKSAFVTEFPDEVPVFGEKNEQSKNVTNQTQQMFVVTPTITEPSQVIEGHVNDELLQKLCQVMEDSNLPGPDYLELKNVANNEEMKKAIPNEVQRLAVAFITMKSSNAQMTKERVLTSIDEYIKMMENERVNGHKQLNDIWDEKVISQKEAVSNAEQKISQLQTELQELLQFVQIKNNEIATASNECNINKANFDATVDFLVNNLKEDKIKLTNTLI